MLRSSNPGGTRFSALVQTGTWAHPASCTMGTGSFPGVKSGRGLTLIPHPLLVPWFRKSRAIPLLPLWAVRRVQSLSACKRVHFTLLFLPYKDYKMPSLTGTSRESLATPNVSRLKVPMGNFCSFY